MKKFIINKIMNSIKQKENYNETKLLEIKYGLESLYITITKTIVFFTISYFLNLFSELLILLLFYGLLKITGFGLHAKKSWMCWLSSGIIFVLLPLLIKYLEINLYIRLIVSILSIIYIFIYAPADTEKRPLINKNKRKIYKVITTVIAISIMIYSFMTNKTIIQNSIFFSLILECIMISPLTYKIFKLKYANYKYYKKPITA